MTKESITFEFVTHDYQTVDSIKLYDIRLNNGKEEMHVPNENLNDDFNDYLDIILKETLKKVDKKLDVRKEWGDGKYFVGRNEARKNEEISIFMSSDESMINGVVGRIREELSYDAKLLKNLGIFKDINGSTTFYGLQSIFVDIIFQSRLDCANSSNEGTHLGEYKGEEYTAGNSFFAAEMLTYGMVDKYNGDVSCNIENLFDFLLIDLFVKSLEVACTKGTYKTYRLFKENNDRIHGSIDIARHIRLNAGLQTGCVAFNYRENTVNNYLNILIVKAYQSISKKYPILVERKISSRPELNGFIKQLMYETDSESVSVRTVIINNLKPISHPYYVEFDETRKICLSILRNEGVNIFDSNDSSVNSFLYYLPDLWENYLSTVFRETLIASSDLADYEVIDQMDDAYYIEGNRKEEYLLHLTPDYLFKKKTGKTYKLNLDAKCIPGWEVINGGREELYKYENKRIKETIIANVDECLRYLEVFDTKATGVVFPIKYYGKKETISEKYDDYLVRRRISEKSKKTFYTVPFLVPASSSGKYTRYSSWKSVFEESKREFVEKMTEEVFNPCLLNENGE